MRPDGEPVRRLLPSLDFRAMHERWFGATGRKVPAIVLEGTLDVSDALVLEDVSDLEAIHTAHDAGTPVVVRCSTADEVHAALSLGPVACALVTDEALLALDLAEMTYG
jgi:hypothetical protein